MRIGPRLVIPGALFGSFFLAVFLYWITAGFVYPTETVLAAPPNEVPAGGDTASSNEALAANLISSSSANGQAGEGADQAALDCRVSGKFPGEILQWCGLITTYAEQFGMPADLVASVIWQESGGDPLAYSKSGAVGLMQVMPNDGLAAGFMCKNGPCFSDRPSTEKLQDPEFNIKYGTRLLAGLVGKQGSYRDGLRAYGPMNVGYYYADIVMNIYNNYKE